MVIQPVVYEILGEGWYHPPDASKLSKRADAINFWRLMAPWGGGCLQNFSRKYRQIVCVWFFAMLLKFYLLTLKNSICGMTVFELFILARTKNLEHLINKIVTYNTGFYFHFSNHLAKNQSMTPLTLPHMGYLKQFYPSLFFKDIPLFLNRWNFQRWFIIVRTLCKN